MRVQRILARLAKYPASLRNPTDVVTHGRAEQLRHACRPPVPESCGWTDSWRRATASLGSGGAKPVTWHSARTIYTVTCGGEAAWGKAGGHLSWRCPALTQQVFKDAAVRATPLGSIRVPLEFQRTLATGGSSSQGPPDGRPRARTDLYREPPVVEVPQYVTPSSGPGPVSRFAGATWRAARSLADVPVLPLTLGLAGAIPFIALAPPVSSFLPLPDLLQEHAVTAQAAYGACILSFLGAPHWGLAMASYSAAPGPLAGGGGATVQALRYVWSVTPALLAWGALLLEPVSRFALLLSSFAAVLGVDALWARLYLVPRWYLPLRVALTAIAMLAMGASFLLVSAQAAAKPLLRAPAAASANEGGARGGARK